MSSLSRKIVEQSIIANAPYIRDCLSKYSQKKIETRILIVGRGRSGKDTVAEYLSQRLGLLYNGSTSYSVLPLIAYSLNMAADECYSRRHENRMYWFDYCNLLRDIDPHVLIKLTLSFSDMLVGTRSVIEFVHALKLFNPQTVIWVERDVPDDPTLEFDRVQAGALSVCNNSNFITVDNNNLTIDLFNTLDEMFGL